MWDATIVVNDLTIPFPFQIAQRGTDVSGAFFNGDEKVTSHSGRFKDGSLVLQYPEYGATLNATLTNGRLVGQYFLATRPAFPFQARRFSPPPVQQKGVPDIAGLWNVQLAKPAREAAWHLIVRQAGPEVSAAILRVDGDTGMLTGRYKDGRFTLSHFSGARPLLLEVTPQPDGTLTVVQRGLPPPTTQGAQNAQKTLVAVRSDDPRAAGLAQPSDPSRFTTLKDPTEPLRFSFPDLQGHVVSYTDRRFRGKVLIV